MPELSVALFAEDRGHEELLLAIVQRIAREEGFHARIRVYSARGGHGRALSELKLYQNSVKRGVSDLQIPDLLIVAIDANCRGFLKARQEIEKILDPSFEFRTVIACPDPHIEKWYMADPVSFHQVVGATPKVGKLKCERDRYKAILATTVIQAGHITTLGGIEFARELAEMMDLHRASGLDNSFRSFSDDLRSFLRQQNS